MAELRLTCGLLDVHDGVVVLEHVDFIDVGKWLDAYKKYSVRNRLYNM